MSELLQSKPIGYRMQASGWQKGTNVRVSKRPRRQIGNLSAEGAGEIWCESGQPVRLLLSMEKKHRGIHVTRWLPAVDEAKPGPEGRTHTRRGPCAEGAVSHRHPFSSRPQSRHTGPSPYRTYGKDNGVQHWQKELWSVLRWPALCGNSTLSTELQKIVNLLDPRH